MTELLSKQQILLYLQSLLLDKSFAATGRIAAAKCLLEHESATSTNAQNNAQQLLESIKFPRLP